MTESTVDPLHALAHTHLPADIAERWIGLLRPGLRLEKATAPETAPVVGRLGGLPELSEATEWPVWEGHGPLAFIASLDCALLPSAALDIAIPKDGTLAFFYFDGQLDDGSALVEPREPDTWAGARVLYVPADVPTAARTTPEGLRPYPEVPLTARAEATAPYSWHPLVDREFTSLPDDHPLWARTSRKLCGTTQRAPITASAATRTPCRTRWSPKSPTAPWAARRGTTPASTRKRSAGSCSPRSTRTTTPT